MSKSDSVVGAAEKLGGEGLDVVPTLITGDNNSEITLGNVPPISPKRRWFALGIFTLSLFIDVANASAFFVFLGPICEDLNIVYAQSTWVVNAYTATFASCLMLWGRISDLYPPTPIFLYGFLTVGVINLVLSFLTNSYAFLILRAIAGIAASSVVPSAYRLIGSIFPPEERGRAYTLYTMTGSIANVCGVILAGVISLIQAEGQMKDWRWFFRIVAAMSIPATGAAYMVIPKGISIPVKTENRFRRMDIPGIMLMLGSVLLLVVALTSGAAYGWSHASFIAPIIISAILFPLFFVWEARIPEEFALVPPSVWKIPNFAVLILFALYILGWWGTNFLPFIQLFNEVHHENLILAAVRTLPEGIIAGIVSVIVVMYPKLTAKPRWPIVGATIMALVALVLWCQAPSITGLNYWRYVLPGMIIGSGGMQVALLSIIVAVMLAVPDDQVGVGSAILSTAMQTSTVLALAIQAGLQTLYPGGLQDYRNVKASWYFELGWGALWCLGLAVLYRPSRSPEKKEVQIHAA